MRKVRLKATDPRISVHLGRLEERQVKNEAALELRQYLSSLSMRIDVGVFHALMEIAKRHGVQDVMVEKAVDVMLTVDLVMMAQRDEFDSAYLLSADGGYTPAVAAASSLGKTVYVCSPAAGAQLARVAKAFIRPRAEWFSDCY